MAASAAVITSVFQAVEDGRPVSLPAESVPLSGSISRSTAPQFIPSFYWPEEVSCFYLEGSRGNPICHLGTFLPPAKPGPGLKQRARISVAKGQESGSGLAGGFGL